MILTNKQMFDSLVVMSNLEETGVLGYAIAKNRRKLMDETHEYAKIREELLKKYGSDLGGGNYELKGEKTVKFFEELKPYDELTVDVPVVCVSEEAFCSGSLTSSAMFALDWMVRAGE